MDANSSPFRIENMQQTLALLEQHLEKNLEYVDQLDDKAKSIISGGSLLLGIITGLQLIRIDEPVPPTYTGLLAIGLIFYALTIIAALTALNPQKHMRPVEARWEVVTSYWHLDDYYLLAQLTSDYIEAIETNLGILEDKATALRNSAIFFAVTVISLIILGFIPR